MKILFVVPPFPNRVREYLILPSLELCIISSILKNDGHIVELLDMKIGNMSIEEGIRRCRAFVPDFILIEDEPKNHCNTIEFVDQFRLFYERNVPICLRGEIPSFIPQIVLDRHPNINYITRFDDDFAFQRIINAHPDFSKIDTIPNIAYRKDDKVVVTDRVECSYDLDSLPKPNRQLYDIAKYLHYLNGTPKPS